MACLSKIYIYTFNFLSKFCMSDVRPHFLYVDLKDQNCALTNETLQRSECCSRKKSTINNVYLPLQTRFTAVEAFNCRLTSVYS
jgi:hypothetical protein